MTIQRKAQRLVELINAWREDGDAGVEAAADLFTDEIEPFLELLSEAEEVVITVGGV
jgi:hypothetical protein